MTDDSPDSEVSERADSVPPGGDHGGEDRSDERRDDRDWEFSLEDLEESDSESDSVATEDTESNVAGPLTTQGPLEPGAIDAENAVFVLLGVGLTVGLLASILLGF